MRGPVPLPRETVSSMSSRARPFRMNVIRKSTRPSSNQGAEYSLRGFGKFVGDYGGDGIAGSKEGSADVGVVADDHCHRHGFTEGAGQREKNRTHDAGARKRHHHLPSGFPSRRTQSQRSFSLVARNGKQRLHARRKYERDTMIASTIPAVRKPTPYAGPWNNGRKPSVAFRVGAITVRIRGITMKYAKHAVDYARNRRQQIDEKCRGSESFCGASSAKKIAAPIPSGTAINNATAEVTTVP